MDAIKHYAGSFINYVFDTDYFNKWLNYEVPFEKVIIHPDYKASYGMVYKFNFKTD